MHRFFGVIMVVAIFFVGCSEGGNSTTPTSTVNEPPTITTQPPTTPVPAPAPASNQPPTITSFTATPSAGIVPLTVIFTATASDPDGTIASVEWDFDANGMVDQTTTALTTSFTYTKTGTFMTTVMAVDNAGARASAATTIIALTISEDAETLVIAFNQQSYGAITRWVKFPILVWAAPGFSRTDLERAISLWEDAIGSVGLDFQITDDQSRANIVFEFGPLPPQATCGEEGPTKITDHVIEAGHGTYSAAPQCTGSGNVAATALAHGLGHILGFAGHTPSDTDIMSAPIVPFRMSAAVAEAMRFIYSVPPGTVIR